MEMQQRKGSIQMVTLGVQRVSWKLKYALEGTDLATKGKVIRSRYSQDHSEDDIRSENFRNLYQHEPNKERYHTYNQ